MTKSSPLVIALVIAVIVLGGALLWQQGQRDCEKRLGPVVETRYMPFKGCLIKLGDEWRSEEDMRNSVKQGVQEMQDGAKKALQGILGK